jgi:hypothetical protein
MRESIGLLRRLLPLLSIGVLAAVIYDGWIFYSRWRSVREGEQARQAEETRRARQTIDLMGGTGFRIINFYASPQVIRRGTPTQICFGVYGAQRVRIDPPIVADLHPAVSYCHQVVPLKDTEYKLIAEDGAGHTAAASLTITVLTPDRTSH